MPLFRSIAQNRQAKRHQARRRRLSVQPLEARRVLAASLGWDGPGLGSADLTYHVANSPDSLSQAETNAAIETALAAWSNAADVSFTPTNQSGLRDSIDISFTNIDGVGGTLAQAYFPDDVNPARIAGDIQFDVSDAWEVGNSLGNRAFDLVYVAVHEIGHSLGLDHAQSFGSVLAPSVSPGQSFTTLEAVDAAEIQDLYASAGGVVTTEDPLDDAAVDGTSTIDTETDTDGADSDDTADSEDDPFPRRRWRRGGRWHRWGGRLDADAPEYNYVNPTDVNDDGSTSALDALAIINQLGGSPTSIDGEEVDVAGLCDTNGDGSITALDALTVINALSMNEGSSDAAAIVDDTGATEVTDVMDEVEDDVDDVGDAEESGNNDDSDTTDETDGTIDDGGLIDDSEDGLDEETDAHRHGRGHRHSGIFSARLFGKDAESLIARFDADADSALSESEVSERLWAKLTDLEVDTDADGLVTLSEIETAITEIRQDAFNEKDVDDDGLLVESEVSTRLWTKISPADTDADGGVSFNELDGFVPDRPTERMERGGRRHHHHSHEEVPGDESNEASDQVFAAIGRSSEFQTPRGRR